MLTLNPDKIFQEARCPKCLYYTRYNIDKKYSVNAICLICPVCSYKNICKIINGHIINGYGSYSPVTEIITVRQAASVEPICKHFNGPIYKHFAGYKVGIFAIFAINSVTDLIWENFTKLYCYKVVLK